MVEIVPSILEKILEFHQCFSHFVIISSWKEVWLLYCRNLNSLHQKMICWNLLSSSGEKEFFNFYAPRDRRSGGILFLSCLSFYHSVLLSKTLTLLITVSARALIFHINIPCDKTFLWVPFFFYRDLDLGVWSIFWNFKLANNFWTVSARALIFHTSIPCDKTFPWVLLFLTLWSSPWSLTNFLKALTLPITFEQWVLELWYFPWVFLVIRPFRE